MKWRECDRCHKVYPEHGNQHTCWNCRKKEERTSRRVRKVVIATVYVATVLAMFAVIAVLWWVSGR